MNPVFQPQLRDADVKTLRVCTWREKNRNARRRMGYKSFNQMPTTKPLAALIALTVMSAAGRYVMAKISIG
jgi:hypothetical protein